MTFRERMINEYSEDAKYFLPRCSDKLYNEFVELVNKMVEEHED